MLTPPTPSGRHGKVQCRNKESVVSAESVLVNLRTLELLIGLIRSFTRVSKGPDIENEDLSSTSSMYRAEFINQNRDHYSHMEGDKSSFSMSGHEPYRSNDRAVASTASIP